LEEGVVFENDLEQIHGVINQVEKKLNQNEVKKALHERKTREKEFKRILQSENSLCNDDLNQQNKLDH
jgi:hypothetical protein